MQIFNIYIYIQILNITLWKDINSLLKTNINLEIY